MTKNSIQTSSRSAPVQRRKSAIAPSARPFADTNSAAIEGAAERFMVLPEVAATMFHGSNGYVARLPASSSARLSLYANWPDPRRCAVLANKLASEMSEPADADQVEEILGGMLAAFPTGDRAPDGYRDGLIGLLGEEAELRGWSGIAVARGCRMILRTSRFLPAPAEIMNAISIANRELRTALWAARTAIDLGEELRWSLVDAGLVDDCDDGEAF